MPVLPRVCRKLKLLLRSRLISGRPSRGLNILDPLGIKTLLALTLKSNERFRSFLEVLLTQETSFGFNGVPRLSAVLPGMCYF